MAVATRPIEHIGVEAKAKRGIQMVRFAGVPYRCGDRMVCVDCSGTVTYEARSYPAPHRLATCTVCEHWSLVGFNGQRVENVNGRLRDAR